jgi:hypothetical protein
MAVQAWHADELEHLERCVVCEFDGLEPLYEDLDAHDRAGWRLDRCPRCGSGLLAGESWDARPEDAMGPPASQPPRVGRRRKSICQVVVRLVGQVVASCGTRLPAREEEQRLVRERVGAQGDGRGQVVRRRRDRDVVRLELDVAPLLGPVGVVPAGSRRPFPGGLHWPGAEICAVQAAPQAVEQGLGQTVHQRRAEVTAVLLLPDAAELADRLAVKKVGCDRARSRPSTGGTSERSWPATRGETARGTGLP